MLRAVVVFPTPKDSPRKQPLKRPRNGAKTKLGDQRFPTNLKPRLITRRILYRINVFWSTRKGVIQYTLRFQTNFKLPTHLRLR